MPISGTLYQKLAANWQEIPVVTPTLPEIDNKLAGNASHNTDPTRKMAEENYPCYSIITGVISLCCILGAFIRTTLPLIVSMTPSSR